MGTLIGNPTASAAFDGQLNKKGLDLNRSVITRELGTEVVDPSTDVRAGSITMRSALGYIIKSDGLDVYGVAKWGKESLGFSVAVDELHVLNGTTAVALNHSGSPSNITVRSAQNMTGTVYAAGGVDYNIVGNTIARDATTTIPDGGTVYVTYTYALLASDFQFDGVFFQGQAADRTQYQEGRITVITDWARLFTVEWATGDSTAGALNNTYALTGVNSNLYAGTAAANQGKFTNDTAGGAKFVGRVYQLPTAQDPYLGVTFGGNPVTV